MTKIKYMLKLIFKNWFDKLVISFKFVRKWHDKI